MKKTILIFIMTLFFLGCNSQNENRVKIFVAWPGVEYLPGYKWNVGDEKPTGVEPILIEKILTKAGYDYEFVDDYKPTKDGDVRIDVLLDKKADISIRSITINEERKEKVNFSIPYYYDGISAMVIDEGIKTTKDFKNKIVYAEKFTTAYDWAIENLPNSKIVNFEDFNSNIQPKDLMLQNKIDVFLSDRTYLLNMMSNNAKFKVLSEKYTKEPYGIAVDKSQTNLLKDINSATTELKKTGELEKLTSGFDK